MGLLPNETDQQYYNGDEFGNYQYISLQNIIDNFTVSYVGEEKLISKVKRTDIIFHASRAIQEFNYDTFPIEEALEIEVTSQLHFVLPRDYVNYVKMSWTDDQGVQRIIYPTSNTSNPKAILQSETGAYLYDNSGGLTFAAESETLGKFKNAPNGQNGDEQDNLYKHNRGSRYGLSPEQAQSNGVFYIDRVEGVVRFSSNMVGKIVTLSYISDGVTGDNPKIPKLAEEAIYKYIAYAILSSRVSTPEYVVARFKKESSAARRNAKIRLSNMKTLEIAQVMRGKSKQIKH
jgi:hypothetical protein